MKELVKLIDSQFVFTEHEEESIKEIFSMDDPSYILSSGLAYRYLEFLLKNSSNPELYESLNEHDRHNFIRIIIQAMKQIYKSDLDHQLKNFEFEYHRENQIYHQLNYL
jgi:hypothetical protein